MSNWLCEDTDGTSLPCHEVLDQSFEGWLSSCLTDSEMELNPDQSSYVHNEANGTQNLQHRTESSNMPERHERESTTMAEHPICIRHNSKFQGKKSFMKTSDTSSTSVVYPFTFLKPCKFSGDMTLKDINRIIHAPPKWQEDPISYSAFSGKPVVAKTKLRTEGGKGSITIMRTKG
ncbi:hypothetical protein LIER_43769 [Lithospermum erythrorhizon]|uniref:Protein XRI1 n=1 Tax=Lithospermum erythrorhizon TaxID=34254 RepID=A0AAV3QRY3_LITER